MYAPSKGILCTCGYDADSDEDLKRHITSWLNWFAEMGETGRDLEHVEA